MNWKQITSVFIDSHRLCAFQGCIVATVAHLWACIIEILPDSFDIHPDLSSYATACCVLVSIGTLPVPACTPAPLSAGFPAAGAGVDASSAAAVGTPASYRATGGGRPSSSGHGYLNSGPKLNKMAAGALGLGLVNREPAA